MSFTMLDDEPQPAAGGFTLLDDGPAAPPGPVGNAANGGIGSAVAMGAMDPIHGGAQLLTRILPRGVVNAGNRFNNWLADNTGLVARIPEGGVDQMVREREAQYQADRAAAGRDGFDAARMAGGVVAPTGVVGNSLIKGVGALSTMTRAGAAAGAMAGAGAPVTEDGDYWAAKAGDVAMGAAGGAVLGPVAGRMAEEVAFRVQKLAPAIRRLGQRAGGAGSPEQQQAVAAAVQEAAEKLRADGVADIPQEAIQQYAAAAGKAVSQGKTINLAEAARRADFDRFRIQPTAGQLTRDPQQYSKELNLRGVDGAGEVIRARLVQQQSQLRQALTAKLGTGARNDRSMAGRGMSDRLTELDDIERTSVSRAYETAREKVGNETLLPTERVTGTYRYVLDEFGEDLVPGAVRKRLSGLLAEDGPGLTVENAERAIKTINRHVDPRDPAKSAALRDLSSSLRLELDALADKGDEVGAEAAGAYQSARDLAKARFQKIERNPILKAVTEGKDPEKFVDRYVVGGSVKELAAMAKDLPDIVPAARGQLLEHLRKKAYPTDAAGDGVFAQASFNRELQRIGRDKLQTLLSPHEVDELYALGRVAAYIGQEPAMATVSRSNSNVPLMNMANLMMRGNQIPFLNIATQSIQRAGQMRDANRALYPAMTARDEAARQTPFVTTLRDLFGLQTSAAAGRNLPRANQD